MRRMNDKVVVWKLKGTLINLNEDKVGAAIRSTLKLTLAPKELTFLWIWVFFFILFRSGIARSRFRGPIKRRSPKNPIYLTVEVFENNVQEFSKSLCASHHPSSTVEQPLLGSRVASSLKKRKEKIISEVEIYFHNPSYIDDSILIGSGSGSNIERISLFIYVYSFFSINRS